MSSFDDFIRSFFLGGYNPTLHVLIFGRLRSGLTPEIDAAATLILIAGCGTSVLLDWRRNKELRPLGQQSLDKQHE